MDKCIIGNLNLTLNLLDVENKKNLKSEHTNLIKNFDCGNQSINNRLKENASDLYQEGYGNTYLIIDQIKKELVAFVILKTTAMVKYDDNVFKYNLEPAIEIDTFAVDKKYQKKYQNIEDKRLEYSISYLVFLHIMKYIRKIAEEKIGARYIIVLSIPEAKKFYEKQGFELITDDLTNCIITPEKMADIYIYGCYFMYYNIWF